VRRKTGSAARFLLAVFFTVIFLFPFALMLMNSVKTSVEFSVNPFSLPTALHLENYTTAISKMHFFRTLGNTLVLTVSVALVLLLFGTMPAYVVSRVKSRFVSSVYYLMIASMVAPFQAFMIPLVRIYSARLGLSDSLVPVIFIAIGLNIAFSVFLVRSYLTSIPVEIEQAALIDGCNQFQLFFRVVFPMLAPINVTLMVFVAMGIWNDYLLSSLFLATQQHRTLAMMIRVFLSQYSIDYAPMMAGLILSILPMLLFYIACQRRILEAVVQGSIK